MTRTDVMASSRPRTAGAASTLRRFSSIRGALALLVTLMLASTALIVPAGAFAATETTSTSKYNQEPPKPEEKEEKGTSPAKEESEPAAEPAPTSTSEPKASTLPFTGLDLRWSFAIGILLIGAGVSIVVVQRRQRRHEQR
jgi:hypothetical protein